jgi:tRNA (guanine-N7-)-methyltransferase
MTEKNRLLRSFGRIKSRIKDSENLLSEFLPKFLIKLEENKTIDLKKLFNNPKEIHLEIGYGYGKSLADRAIKNPEIGFVGCEVYQNGILNLLKKIKEKNIQNIKLYDKDARLFLETLQDNSIDKIFILFPDPWPKKRHKKRRIINQDLLDTIYSKLKKDGTLFFASDIADYIDWTLEHIKENGKFKTNFKNLEETKIEPDWWIKTKYQEKAIKEGRESNFLEFKKW